MELWGRVQNVMEASGIHQLLAQLEQKMQEETTRFAEEMYKYVDDSAGQLEKTLAPYGGRSKLYRNKSQYCSNRTI